MSMWLDGADACWTMSRSWSVLQTIEDQMRMADGMLGHAIRLWSLGFLLNPDPRRGTAERMAALSLRVVEGGRR